MTIIGHLVLHRRPYEDRPCLQWLLNFISLDCICVCMVLCSSTVSWNATKVSNNFKEFQDLGGKNKRLKEKYKFEKNPHIFYIIFEFLEPHCGMYETDLLLRYRILYIGGNKCFWLSFVCAIVIDGTIGYCENFHRRTRERRGMAGG